MKMQSPTFQKDKTVQKTTDPLKNKIERITVEVTEKDRADYRNKDYFFRWKPASHS